MRLRFASTELGEEYWQLYKAKHMRAVSIGFIPMEWHEEKTEKTGRIWVIDKLELLEISCVAVGANREALSKVKGMFENLSGEPKPATLTKKDVTDIVTEQLKNVVEKIDEIQDMLADSNGFAKELLLDDSDESPDSGGKEFTEQQILDAVQTALKTVKF